MSKYLQRGPYHFVEFADTKTTYHLHVMALLASLRRYFPLQHTVHEVGCGEGLILSQIRQRMGWRVSGNDGDLEAVRLARLLVPGIEITLTDDAPAQFPAVQGLVLFADSLEHIEDWERHIKWAKQADSVAIAVPSTHDRHGIRDFNPHDFDTIMDGFECLEKSTRHNRHFSLWRKK
jgi:2-polyprenyl-3-methyl-5-hydroxy-6-metoxy-1,4-benzoquinol methylase